MYKLKYHPNLTIERWNDFPRHKRILMIANELQRALNMIDKNDRTEFRNALERAFELLDLTVETTSRRNEIRELLRLRELMAQSFLDENIDRSPVESMMNALISMDKTAFHQLDQND
ncbi:hypothetical protein A2Y85_02795 [candidate division WOR-3 bacterium RBG_13_43_14]|uniref:Uncharacterized protein n=1 Tax=candidate division WOR-3 bacterium RBG_13_43_14 TaxID=1802590 RepID=A0A1F4U314_UNCW3|nr:MAG: hypothetical protein A2Y85_02795 [candidate division WOR-3 bacterium RBG_13_43_14]